MTVTAGYLCITRNSQWPGNNGRLVMVLLVDPLRAEAPYLIRDVTGRRFVQGRSMLTGRPMMLHPSVNIWSARRYLRPLDPEPAHAESRNQFEHQAPIAMSVE